MYKMYLNTNPKSIWKMLPETLLVKKWFYGFRDSLYADNLALSSVDYPSQVHPPPNSNCREGVVWKEAALEAPTLVYL